MGEIIFVYPVFILIEYLTEGTRSDISIIDAFNDAELCSHFHLSRALRAWGQDDPKWHLTERRSLVVNTHTLNSESSWYETNHRNSCNYQSLNLQEKYGTVL